VTPQVSAGFVAIAAILCLVLVIAAIATIAINAWERYGENAKLRREPEIQRTMEVMEPVRKVVTEPEVDDGNPECLPDQA
jgi:hypoxanthine phosphoribosyltransferase